MLGTRPDRRNAEQFMIQLLDAHRTAFHADRAWVDDLLDME